MTENIVDLAAHRNRADQPDPEFVSRDFRTDHIDTMYKFIGYYRFDGATWDFECWARDLAEAERKMLAVSAGEIDGQLMCVVPA